jgi:hypothetical protein
LGGLLTWWPIWVGYSACAWALAFAAAHYYWAFGGAWLVGEAGVQQSRELLAQDPWYYWVSWMVLSTAFVAAGSFPRWIREVHIWGSCGVLLLLVAALIASSGRSWVQAPFFLCASGLALVRFRFGTMPPRAMIAATGVMGLGMALYGALGLAYASLWGTWWLAGGLLFVATAWAHLLRPAMFSGR